MTAPEVDEVEPQPIRRDQRAGLLDVRSEHLPQRGVEQVSGGVVAPRGVAHRGVDLGVDQVAMMQRAPCHA